MATKPESEVYLACGPGFITGSELEKALAELYPGTPPEDATKEQIAEAIRHHRRERKQ
jgi:hypothetical protein